MLKIFNRGLSKEEVAKTLKKIRHEYNNYIISYLKSPKTKEAFESRYYFASKYKENMGIFFKNEIDIVTSLILVEEDRKLQKEKDESIANNRRKRSNVSIADKYMEEFEERIKGYPEIDINTDSSIEVRKLYGALRLFEERYWNSFSRYIKTSTPMGRMIDHLENDLWLLIGTDRRHSPVLDKYILLLDQRDPDLKALSFAEQGCMKQAAFFLNDILELYRNSVTDVPPPKTAVDAYNYISQIVFNFRLADLKKTNKLQGNYQNQK